jgi:hypothetical protein
VLVRGLGTRARIPDIQEDAAMQSMKSRTAQTGAKRRAAPNQVSTRVTRAAKSEAAEWRELDAAIDASGVRVDELYRRLDEATKLLQS